MLARDKGNFHSPGKNRTHDPPNTTCLSDVPTTETEGRKFNSCLGHGNRTRDPPFQWLECPINM